MNRNMMAAVENHWTMNAGRFIVPCNALVKLDTCGPMFWGVVLHALGLNPAIMTAVVVDDVVFDDLFRELVTVNAEGQVVTSVDDDQSVYGLPFTEAIVRQFLDREPLSGTSAACLALAWRYRDSLVQY